MKHFYLKLVSITMLLSLLTFFGNAQNVAVTDDESYTADPSAMLDVKSLTKGLLVPRLTTTQRNAIASPAKGLLVFDTDVEKFYFYDGTEWKNLSAEGIWLLNGNNLYLSNENKRVGIGVSNANSKLEVKADASFGENDTLFVVKDNAGYPVFAVFPDGAKVFVDQTTKGKIGGFAVSGRTSTKFTEEDYFHVTPDSTRITFNDAEKGKVGGFAVSGRTSTKETTASLINLFPENYFIGHESGLNTSGLYNNFIGYRAGYMNKTGHDNIFLGYESGFSNDNGWNNLFLGNSSGYSNIDGEENTFIGLESGYSNNSGRYNVFIGSSTGYANESGFENVYIGFRAGKNSTGSGNVFMGSWAGNDNINGIYNTFIGMHAGMHETGSGNTYLGYSTGGTGNYNSCIGYMTGLRNSGTGNVLIGYQSAANDTIGNKNTFIGYRTGYNLKNGSNNIFIGANAGTDAHGNDQLYIENSAVDSTSSLVWGNFSTNILTFNATVGIGTTVPSERLEVVNGNIRVTNGSFIDDGTPVSDFVFTNDYQLESIEEHAAFMWKNKHLPALQSAGEIERAGGYDISLRREQMLEELEKAHIYIEQLNNDIKSLENKNIYLEKQLENQQGQINQLMLEIEKLKN